MFSCFLILLAFLAFISKPVHSQYTLTPFAGTGTQGNNGDNGQATSANVNFIANTWVDTNGVTFVVDYSANVIRQVAVDGIITTIGGTGTAAISNSGGAFTSVALYSPWGVNGDSTYLYFSDNYHVWKYTRATGIVAILAGTGTQGTTGDGGPGASAQINKANGLWMNSDNCLYIAEYGNNLLRKIDLATTVISTVAGGGGSGIGGDGGPAVSTNTKLNAPQGVYIDTNGVIFIADRNNARVRYIVNGIINTYAGGGPSSNTADGFVGTDAYFSSPFDVKGDTMGNIFAVEGANKVKVVDYATKVVTTYLSTGLNAPRGIWLDYLNGRSIISMLGYAKTAPLYVNPVPSESPTAMPTFIATASPSAIPTVTPSAAPSAVPTFTPSATPSAAPTFVPTVTPTFVPSAVPTATPSASPSATPTAAPTALPSSQPSSRPSGQPSTAPSAQPSSHPSSQPSSDPTGQPSSSPSSQPSSQPSAQPSRQPTSSPSSQPSSHPSSQPSTNPSSQPTSSPSSQPSTHPSGQPSAQPSNCPSSQPSSSPSAQPSSHPSSQPSSHPSSQPSSSPSSQPSAQPSSQPSAQPSNRPSGQPSSSPSAQPSSHPSSQPSSHPSSQPSSSPSSQPSAQPSSQPSAQPSSRPSSQPSSQPSAQPSTRPSSQPSSVPSSQPSAQPTSQPTTSSSSKPTGAPSSQPSSRPSSQPSAQPSSQPSGQPSSAPSAQPSSQPSSIPSSQPSSIPTSQPSVQPSSQPTSLPTSQPTMSPTAPTFKPTRAPSFSPTVKNDDVVKVSGTSRVRFVNGQTLNDLSLATILTAFQNISDNAQSTVITSAVLVNASTTQSQSNTASGRNMRRGLGASVSGQAVSNKPSYTYDIGFLSTYVMTFHPTYASASQLAASKTTTIRQAIEVGQFESALRFLAVANNATQLLNSSSTEVKSIDSVVVPASSTSSSSNNDDGLSAGTVAGIVIGILGGCLVLGIVLYVVLKRYDDEKKRREEMNVERKNSDHFTAL